MRAPVGWCAFERRTELARLDRAPSLRVVDAAQVWSLPCFYVKVGWRGQGVATALLAGAEAALRERRATIVEAYPTRPTGAGKLSATGAYTSVPSMFAGAGFERADAKPRGKQRYRKALRRRA